MTTEEWDEIFPINAKTKEELEKQIWQRYGSFELSHDKNKLIVGNILEFILEEREDYLKSQIKSILSDYTDVILKNATTKEKTKNHYGGSSGLEVSRTIIIDKKSITNQLPEFLKQYYNGTN